MINNGFMFVGSTEFSNVSNPIDIPFTLDRDVIILDLDSPQKKQTWNKAGNIIQVLRVDAISSLVEVSDSYSYLGFNPTLLKFQIESGNNYKIRFKPVPWLTQFTISIWQYYGI